MKIAKKYMNMGAIATILSRKGSVRSAVTFQELAKLCKLSKKEITKAIEQMKYYGMNVVATDHNPPRYYWSSKI